MFCVFSLPVTLNNKKTIENGSEKLVYNLIFQEKRRVSHTKDTPEIRFFEKKKVIF
jgi:hypothetical protein